MYEWIYIQMEHWLNNKFVFLTVGYLCNIQFCFFVMALVEIVEQIKLCCVYDYKTTMI